MSLRHSLQFYTTAVGWLGYSDQKIRLVVYFEYVFETFFTIWLVKYLSIFLLIFDWLLLIWRNVSISICLNFCKDVKNENLIKSFKITCNTIKPILRLNLKKKVWHAEHRFEQLFLMEKSFCKYFQASSNTFLTSL